jgi:transcription-repair coupling factor
MQNIVSYFSEGEFHDSADLFFRNKSVTYSSSGNQSSKALVISNILREASRKDAPGRVGNLLWVVNDEQGMEKTKRALNTWGSREVFGFSGLKDDDKSRYSMSSDFEREKKIRLTEFVSSVISRGGKDIVFVMPFEYIFNKFPCGKEMERRSFEVYVEKEPDVVEFIGAIVDIGYENADDEYIKKGQYFKIGDSVFVWPINKDGAFRIEFSFDKVEKISEYNVEDKKSGGLKKKLKLYPVDYEEEVDSILDLMNEESVVIDDELDVTDDYYSAWNVFMEEANKKAQTVSFTSFNEDESNHASLHFYSVLKYRTGYDFANDLRDKINAGWRILIFTKDSGEVGGLLADQKVPFRRELPKNGFENDLSSKGEKGGEIGAVYFVDVDKEDYFPQAFQAPDYKILLVSDLEISLLREKEGRSSSSGSGKVFEDFISGLKPGDYVVHADHGIARFKGLDRKTVDDITREYLKLAYAENDKLFVPIDQADKVNKYIGSEETMPKLTRLGSAEWSTMTAKVRKETQKIAKELLALYAQRKAAQGVSYKDDNDLQGKFEDTFPYEETPGQMKAINDVKKDMESDEPMDRLVCGDVGFGKTEVAMRAAFKAAQSGKQVALIAPITILADQHYRSFKKRMGPFHVRVEMLSRFKSAKEQAVTLGHLAKGEVDVVVGTHRLLQPDIKFKDLGLIVVDEEQRFGVKQKETLTQMRAEVDVLTLTATPIPRTLNVCLNKLRDITTITTPPPGRLPIITEVRKFSPGLVRDAILREVERGGQVYFLHNRVQTIDSMADQLRGMVPEATFCVAHGKLGSGDLEERIMSFKDKKYDVLVSSTIIENGIDLANANTLIVNNAEKFGLAQLYQLRGRVGRAKTQAYAYFLYHGQRLHLDAKKRLRAIVEASDLGSGFQIAMKDLEIRGAGDILGANQHGVINVVGVPHFIRMLNKAVEDLKSGRADVLSGAEEEPEVTIELPIPAFIPDDYIVNARDKIAAYQKLAGVDSAEYLEEIREEMLQDFGRLPREVSNLFRIIELKILAKKAGITNIRSESVRGGKEIVLTMGPRVRPGNIVSLLEYSPLWNIGGTKLRVGITDLGAQWFEELKECMKKLGKTVKHGKR